jgi:hypothetical protein
MQTEQQTTGPDLDVQPAAPAAVPATRPANAVAPATTPMDLLRIVTERGASPEEIAKFMDLMERQQDREAQQAFVRAMAVFKKRVPSIVKDAGAAFEAKGQNVSYDYATLGNICEKITVALADVGISHDWDLRQPDNGMIVVKCTLTHEDGGSKSTTIQFPPDPSGSKNGLQAIGSAVTYGERYTLLAVCGIAVKAQGDDDGRGAGNPVLGPGESQLEVRPDGTTVDHSTTQDERLAIEGHDLARAIAAIKAKRYSWDKLTETYRLTAAQLVLTKKELGIK